MERPTPELIEKIKQVKTEEELVALARENGIDLYNTDRRIRVGWTRYTDIRLTEPEHNKIRPELKYDMSAYRFLGDYGTRYDPVPKGFVLCDLFDVEFLVREERMPTLTPDLKNPKIRDFLADFAKYHNERIMYIGINVKDEPYISSNPFIPECEREKFFVFCFDGVDVVTKKGAFDIDDEKDIALLKKLVDHYKNQRVRLSYEGDPGGYEDYSTYCIIWDKIKTGDDA